MEGSREQHASMLDVTVTEHKQRHSPPKLQPSQWKTILAVLFIGAFALECTNIMLTSKCETHSDASETLRSILNTLSEKYLANLSITVRYPEVFNTTTPRSTASSTIDHSPMCDPITEYKLQLSDKRVNVCTYRGVVRIDIRQFLNDRATIKGIYFNVKEFLSLSDIFPLIQVEVNRHIQLLGI